MSLAGAPTPTAASAGAHAASTSASNNRKRKNTIVVSSSALGALAGEFMQMEQHPHSHSHSHTTHTHTHAHPPAAHPLTHAQSAAPLTSKSRSSQRRKRAGTAGEALIAAAASAIAANVSTPTLSAAESSSASTSSNTAAATSTTAVSLSLPSPCLLARDSAASPDGLPSILPLTSHPPHTHRTSSHGHSHGHDSRRSSDSAKNRATPTSQIIGGGGSGSAPRTRRGTVSASSSRRGTVIHDTPPILSATARSVSNSRRGTSSIHNASKFISEALEQYERQRSIQQQEYASLHYTYTSPTGVSAAHEHHSAAPSASVSPATSTAATPLVSPQLRASSLTPLETMGGVPLLPLHSARSSAFTPTAGGGNNRMDGGSGSPHQHARQQSSSTRASSALSMRDYRAQMAMTMTMANAAGNASVDGTTGHPTIPTAVGTVLGALKGTNETTVDDSAIPRPAGSSSRSSSPFPTAFVSFPPRSLSHATFPSHRPHHAPYHSSLSFPFQPHHQPSSSISSTAPAQFILPTNDSGSNTASHSARQTPVHMYTELHGADQPSPDIQTAASGKESSTTPIASQSYSQSWPVARASHTEDGSVAATGSNATLHAGSGSGSGADLSAVPREESTTPLSNLLSPSGPIRSPTNANTHTYASDADFHMTPFSPSNAPVYPHTALTGVMHPDVASARAVSAVLSRALPTSSGASLTASDVISEGDEEEYGVEDDEMYDSDDNEIDESSALFGDDDDEYDEDVDGGGVASNPALLSEEESLAELSLVRMSRWTLRFENSKMEGIYRKHFSSKLSSNFLLLNLLVVAQHLFLGCVEWATGSTSGDIVIPVVACRSAIVATFLTTAGITFMHKRAQKRKVRRSGKEMELQKEMGEDEPTSGNQQQPHIRHMSTEQQSSDINDDMMEKGGLSSEMVDIEMQSVPSIHAASGSVTAVLSPPSAGSDANANALQSHHSPLSSLPSSSSSSSSTSCAVNDGYGDNTLSNDHDHGEEGGVDGEDGDEDEGETASLSPPPLFLIKLIVLLNLIQCICLLVAFSLASYTDVAQQSDDGSGDSSDTSHVLTWYAPTGGELATAFTLVLYGFIFLGSGMLLIYALPLALIFFITSLALSLSFSTPTPMFLSSIILQFLFLCLCTWNLYSIELGTRKELILLCTVARDRALGTDLLHQMLPPAMATRLQLMQMHTLDQQETEVKDEEGILINDGGDERQENTEAEDEAEAGVELEADGDDEMKTDQYEEANEDGQIIVHPTSGTGLSDSVSPNLLLSPSLYDVYDDVSVLFCSISAFSELVSYLDPQALVRLLNDIYSAFDDAILTAAPMYKVEAISDTYMAVSGCPFVDVFHARTVAQFAFEMMDIMQRNQTQYATPLLLKQQQHARMQRKSSIKGMSVTPSAHSQSQSQSPPPLSPMLPPLPVQIQIGIHSGPIAAGVIGTKTLSYHCFGQ